MSNPGVQCGRAGRGRPVRRFLLLIGVALLALAALSGLGWIGRAAHQTFQTVYPRADGSVVVGRGEHITHDLVATNGDIYLNTDTTVAGNVTATGGNIILAQGSQVNGNVTTEGGQVWVFGQVDGDVTTLNGNISLGPSARVNGNVTTATGQVFRAQGAHVDGNITSATGPVHSPAVPLPPAPSAPGAAPSAPASGPSAPPAPIAPARDTGRSVFGWLFLLFSALAFSVMVLVLGTLLLVGAPRHVARVEGTLEHAFVPSVIVGGLSAVLLPPVVIVLSFILAITIIGPILLAFAVLAAWFLGLVGLGLWVGERLSGLALVGGSPLRRGLLGLALILAATALPGIFLPWLAWPLAYLLGCLGLGAVVLSRGGTIVPVADAPLPFGLSHITDHLPGGHHDTLGGRKAS